MEYGYFHAIAQLLLDVETFRGLDVFQIDAAESGLEACDDVHQLVRIALVYFNIEYVDSGEFLEQHTLAFHYRFGCQRANRAQAEHCGAIRDHPDKIAARGEVPCRGWVPDDFFAGSGDSGRICKRKIALVE